jgi:hypothetical protein
MAINNIYERIEELYPLALEHTKALNNDPKATKRFRTRLGSVNHLSHEGSKLKHSPLARIAEEVLDIYFFLKKRVQRLKKRLFPRNHVIYGTAKDASLVGRLTFSEREDIHVPIHHMYLEFWARTRLGHWRLLSVGATDKNGYFELPFDLMAAQGYDIRKLWLEVHHTGMHRFEGYTAKPIHELFERFPVKKGDLTGMSYDMGMMKLHYWEYRKDTPLPRVQVKDHEEDPPEKYAPGRVAAIEKQFIPIELTTKKHLAKIKLDDHGLTIDEIQEDYPENLTVCMEEEEPGITRSDEWFGIRFMNGMYASTFDKDPDDPSLYWVYYHWSSYATDSEIYAIPDVSIKFRMQDNGYLIPVEITLKGKLRPGGSKSEKVTLTPEDGSRWEAAKRVARVSGAIATEIDRHFAETHTNVEQMAIATRRNIRLNPLGAILFPHLKEVSLINHTADQILINDEGYIAQATAISAEGLSKRVYDVMGTLDWKGWKPMEPLSEKHTYAKAANLFYDVTYNFVDHFIEHHKEGIIDEWHEVYTLSKDLVQHSVKVFMCGYLKNKLQPDKEGRVLETAGNDWFNRSNRMDLNLTRCPFSKGEALERRWISHVDNHEEEKEPSEFRRAMSHITENEHYDPESRDLQNLKEFCTYAIFQSTFGHFWSNSKQYDDIGEIKYSSLGIRLGTPEHGILGPEDDPTISPDLKISTQMMWWSNMLSRTGYGFLTKNEEKDISPYFIELLEKEREAFAALDLDIDDIQSRTNI